jgi:peptidoglycan/xylan/chitin deacetylase (PgdA/CDA1 family)
MTSRSRLFSLRRGAHALALRAATAALIAAAVPMAAVAGETAPLCAAPAPSSAGEAAIRKGAAEARVAVPDYGAFAQARAAAPIAGAIRRVDLHGAEKLVALTFDLCETSGEVAGYDGAVFDTLRAKQVPATIFAGGHWATTHAGRMGEIARDPLFEIGNHTWSHANLRLADPAKLAREVLAPEAALAPARAAAAQCRRADAASPRSTDIRSAPARSTLFRFPFGACNANAMAAVNGAGMMAIQWDVSSGDPSPLMSADAIVAATLAGVRPGSIVLMHANGRGYHTGSALPRVIDALRAKGYRLVTVSELLAAGTPVVTETCYDARPGDTDRYDTWGRKPARSVSSWPTSSPMPAAAPETTGSVIARRPISTEGPPATKH